MMIMMKKKEIQFEREMLLQKSKQVIKELKKDIIWLESYVVKDDNELKYSPYVFDVSKRISLLESYIIQDSVLKTVQEGKIKI